MHAEMCCIKPQHDHASALKGPADSNKRACMLLKSIALPVASLASSYRTQPARCASGLHPQEETHAC